MKSIVESILVLSTVFGCTVAGGAGLHSNYHVVPQDFDVDLPDVAHEIWPGIPPGYVQRQLFFLQMQVKVWSQQLAGLTQFVFAILACLAASTLWLKASAYLSEQSWWYKDDTGEVRGPFSTAAMKLWRHKGYLKDDLLIRYTANSTFVPLRELFPAPATPFQAHPVLPQVPQRISTSATVQEELFEQEALQDMVRAQCEAFEYRARDLEDEMTLALEADLQESIQLDDVRPQTTTKEKESWDSFGKPQVMDPEESAQLASWSSKRQLNRREMASAQVRRYYADTLSSSIQQRWPTKDKQLKKKCLEQLRIEKEFTTWFCNDMMSGHEAELNESFDIQLSN